MSVATRFNGFLENIKLTATQVADGTTKHKNVRSCLNAYYYNSSSEEANSQLVGSWGKSTRVRPPRDIDVLFELPASVYWRFEQRSGNKQSQILQEVKDVLSRRFPSTAIKGDGPAVVIPFQTFKVELVPAFKTTTGRYSICITKGTGSYKTFDPHAEREHVRMSDERSKGNTRALIRIAKTWQSYCSVPIKSFHLELLGVQFFSSWQHFDKGHMWYDWMVRDYFGYIKERDYTFLTVLGTSESMLLDGSWKSRAETAYNRAVEACEHERNERPYSAGGEWQKIFETSIPIT